MGVFAPPLCFIFPIGCGGPPARTTRTIQYQNLASCGVKCTHEGMAPRCPRYSAAPRVAAWLHAMRIYKGQCAILAGFIGLSFCCGAWPRTTHTLQSRVLQTAGPGGLRTFPHVATCLLHFTTFYYVSTTLNYIFRDSLRKFEKVGEGSRR